MAVSRAKCVHCKDSFCYVCGEYRQSASLRAISETVRQLCAEYFGRVVREKEWTPKVVCTSSICGLTQWSKKKKDKMAFGVPMIWSEASYHEEDCYFCFTEINDMNSRNRRKWKYAVVQSACRPLPHSAEVPVPIYREAEPESATLEPSLVGC